MQIIALDYWLYSTIITVVGLVLFCLLDRETMVSAYIASIAVGIFGGWLLWPFVVYYTIKRVIH